MPRHTACARSGQDRTGLYQEITTKIIAELEACRAPWVQPWGTAAGKAPLAMPKNAATQRRYTGINVLILWGAVIEHGFTGQSWLTFRQALSLDGHVRKGERGTTVVYADCFTPEDERRRAAETGDEAQMSREIQSVLKTAFLPEFLNRVDETIIFGPLGRKELTEIVEIQLRRLDRQLSEAGLTLRVSRGARAQLAEEGFEPAFGARPLKRVIQHRLANPLANALLEQKVREGDVVEVDFAGSEFTFNPVCSADKK